MRLHVYRTKILGFDDWDLIVLTEEEHKEQLEEPEEEDPVLIHEYLGAYVPEITGDNQ